MIIAQQIFPTFLWEGARFPPSPVSCAFVTKGWLTAYVQLFHSVVGSSVLITIAHSPHTHNNNSMYRVCCSSCGLQFQSEMPIWRTTQTVSNSTKDPKKNSKRRSNWRLFDFMSMDKSLRWCFWLTVTHRCHVVGESNDWQYIHREP